MPFRQPKAVKEALELRRRTGEPSPALTIDLTGYFQSDGYNKRSGSFTEKMHFALRHWIDKNYGSWLSPINFEYKLSRKKTVTVTGAILGLLHHPHRGAGQRGFVMNVAVDSIDGLPVQSPRMRVFSWNRIIGREKILQLGRGE